MMEVVRERSLVNAARSGSLPAFDELLESHRKRMIRIALTIVHHVDDAEDVTQIASLRAFKNLHTFIPRASFTSWLAAIVRNAAIDSMRRRQPLFEEFDDRVTSMQSARFDPEFLTMRGHESAALANAVATLPASYREPLNLYYVSELSYSEIAENLRLPIGTVKTHLSRGKALLRNDASFANSMLEVERVDGCYRSARST